MTDKVPVADPFVEFGSETVNVALCPVPRVALLNVRPVTAPLVLFVATVPLAVPLSVPLTGVAVKKRLSLPVAEFFTVKLMPAFVLAMTFSGVTVIVPIVAGVRKLSRTTLPLLYVT